MAKGLNRVMLIGYVGKDPEMRYLENGTACCNFSLATDESYKDASGQKVEQTEWHRLVAYGKRAETIQQYIGKGSRMYFEGKLKTRKWVDTGGVDRYMTEIIVQSFSFLNTKDSGGASPLQDEGQRQQSQTKRAPAQDLADDFDDDIPF